MTSDTKIKSSSTLDGSSKAKFVLPKRGYGVAGLNSLVPGNLLAFGFFFVVYLFMTVTLAGVTLVNNTEQSDLKLYAVSAVAFLGAGLCGLRTFSLYHKWQSERFATATKVEKARDAYIDDVLTPWCEDFNVFLSGEESSRLLNGEVVPATIGDSEGFVALVKNGKTYKLVEVSAVEDFVKEVPQLKTKHYDSGEMKIVPTVKSEDFRVRVDSFASYFGQDSNFDGFVDMSAAPGFGFVRTK